MSFEGFTQILCKNGHLDEVDVYGSIPENWQCPFCGAELAWHNTVNQTNCCCYIGDFKRNCPDYPACDGFGINYVKLEMLQPEVYETCDKCGHSKCTQEKTYKIPEDKGHKV